ncbi:MAG TPA: DUF2207 domain-containing protein [Acidimicrobiia bacterium]|nr:DUF2207 domain-containing protein [Acidimicrobiia bacterium]
MRRLTGLLVGAAVVVLAALPAAAKSYHIESADVNIDVDSDGSLLITERITFDFDGSFSGAYRDVPIASDETFELVSIGDELVEYDSGGCAWLGCSSPPGTYGVDEQPGFARVVWHHSSNDETRTFELVYRMTGVVEVYDDIADLQYQVWGDQWGVRADLVTAQVNLPPGASPGDLRVYGHPYGVDGESFLGDDGVTPGLEARDVPPHRFVEIRVVFPPSLLTSSAGVSVVAGVGLDVILDEETASAEEANDARSAARNGLVAGALAFIGLVGGAGGLVYARYGREPRTGYDREYEQFPPSELSPAEVGALISQGAVTEKQFTATLFDLIRQGVLTAEPSQVTRVTWGGFRSEEITDLVIGLTDRETGLRDFEQSVLTVLRRALAAGSMPLHELNDAIRSDAAANAKTYQTFRERVQGAVRRSRLLDDAGSTVSWLVRIGAVGLVVAAMFTLPRWLSGRPGAEGFLVSFFVGAIAGAVVLFIFLSFRRVHVRRTKQGAMEAERWLAFRRYLRDFSRLEEAPSISLALWDQFLVYGISLGVAEQVLEQARLHAPVELEQASSLYWYGHHGYGGGSTQNAFVGLESALSGAFTPPSSGSGGGGGFSGGGGGGSGGGGGGAW